MWADDDLRGVFVAGASWMYLQTVGTTMWTTEREEAEAEAERRYPGGATVNVGGDAKAMILAAMRAMVYNIKHGEGSDWKDYMRYDLLLQRLVAMFNDPARGGSSCDGSGSGWCGCPEDGEE